MGLFSRGTTGKSKEASPPQETPEPQARETQSPTAPGENPSTGPMPWLQDVGASPSLGDLAPTPQPQANASPLPPEQPSTQPPPAQDTPPPAENPPQKNGNGLSDDLRSLFASEATVDPELQGLASDLEEVDIQQLARLAQEVASLVRR
ncbi:hypothetical protein HRbin23_00063 [bacterium HR23]|nr:hypothetical protein HRbin23_00063 [bacterium HR23]